MATLSVRGLRIAVHEWRPKAEAEPAPTPLVCLPSTGLSGMQWRRLGKLMSKRGRRVLAPDFIAYGESEGWASPEPFTTEADVDVAEAVAALCPGPLHLVGHSYGGRVALRLALREPERLRSLALFEPTCFGVLRSTGDREGLAELEDYGDKTRFLDPEFGGSPEWVERFVDYWSGPGAWAELGAEAQASWLKARRKMFEEVRETALDDIPHHRYVAALGRLPLLLMSGAESTLAGRRTCARLAEVWPHQNTRHLELDEVGHMAPLLAAREVAEAIAAFIEQVEADGPEPAP